MPGEFLGASERSPEPQSKRVHATGQPSEFGAQFDVLVMQAAVRLQLKEIEDECKAHVGKALTVFSKEVALEQARPIKGLRAVFGEVLPPCRPWWSHLMMAVIGFCQLDGRHHGMSSAVSCKQPQSMDYLALCRYVFRGSMRTVADSAYAALA